MRNGFMKQATVVGACAGYAAYCLFVGSAGIRTSPDSVFYLSFSPIVPTGYPVFLRLLGAEGAVVVQPLVFAASLAWLGLEIVRQWSSLALALGGDRRRRRRAGAGRAPLVRAHRVALHVVRAHAARFDGAVPLGSRPRLQRRWPPSSPVSPRPFGTPATCSSRSCW